MNLVRRGQSQSSTPIVGARAASVAVVIVNYRTAGLTLDCLRSLLPEVMALESVHVWVVDNQSGDGSLEMIQAAVSENAGWARSVTVGAAGRNGGFACGNNVALRKLLSAPNPPEYVLLLNPDTIVRPGAISALLGFMQQRPDVGIAGSRLEHTNGEVQASAFPFPSWLGEFERGFCFGPVTRLLSRWSVVQPIPDQTAEAEWVSGASFLIRRSVFDSIGLLDERYFMYYEEVDFCLRARRAGWQCWYVPESRVVHLVGQSSGITASSRRRLPKYWFDSRNLYFRKNYGRPYSWLANVAWGGAYALYRFRCVLQRKPISDPQWLWWDFVRYSCRPSNSANLR